MNLEVFLFVAGVLLLICVFASRISDKHGIPSLLVFLAIGMLAGEGGMGRVRFDDVTRANEFGTVALAFILFSGGLDTKWKEVRPALLRGGLLSSLGVFLTAATMFACSYFFFGMDKDMALLLSVIVSSTDAPAVISALRAGKGNGELKPGLKPLLEFESGSNDPMAVLLTLGALGVLSSGDFSLARTAEHLVWEILIGCFAGYAVGKGFARILAKWELTYAGLYPVLGVGLVFITYSLSQLLGGNGFLSVYLCGIVLGNSFFFHRRVFIRFQDSLSWVMQIGMFLVLGLLVDPAEMPKVMPIGLLCALCLMFAARPLAVFACLWKSRYSREEKMFVSWAGLKGAVPIILATYPMLEGFPNSKYLFNVIFFLVVISVLFQGKTLPYAAARLGLYRKPGSEGEVPPAPEAGQIAAE